MISPSHNRTQEDTAIFLGCLMAEHTAMVASLNALGEAIASQNRQQAQTLFQDILNDMRVHFACEEQVLFPMVHPYRTMVLMEVEHDEIFARRDALATLLLPENIHHDCWPELTQAFERFSAYLKTHIQEEDRGVFPFCAKVLSETEKQRVTEGMAALRKADELHPLPPIYRAEGHFDSFSVKSHDWERQEKPIQIQLLAKGESFEMKQLFLKAQSALASHWTPHQLTLICQTGQLQFESQGKQCILNPGEAVTLSPRLNHAVLALEDSQVLQLFHHLTPDRFWVGLTPETK